MIIIIREKNRKMKVTFGLRTIRPHNLVNAPSLWILIHPSNVHFTHYYEFNIFVNV